MTCKEIAEKKTVKIKCKNVSQAADMYLQQQQTANKRSYNLSK